MKRQPRHKIRFYTLVEIMVAMAILVIMMGFLFQFVIGAQRIWSTSESISSTFDQAQIAMQLLENDLQSVLFASDEIDPGHSIPFGLQRDSKRNLIRLFMVVPYSRTVGDVGTYMVIYTLNNNELYRTVFHDSISVPPSYDPYCFYGFDPVRNTKQSGDDTQAKAFIDIIEKLEKDPDQREVIARGITSIRISYFPADCVEVIADIDFFVNVPKVTKISLIAYDANAVRRLKDGGLTSGDTPVQNKITETSREFSKIVFLR